MLINKPKIKIHFFYLKLYFNEIISYNPNFQSRMNKLSEFYKTSWEGIVKPFRMTYSEHDLGPVTMFTPKGNQIAREDFSVQNKKNQNLQVSLFRMENLKGGFYKKPCIIYLHSHSGCRIESLQILEYVSDYFSLCTFDFSGSGNSEGEYVTLGLKELEDLDCVKSYIEQKFRINIFYLWGRSMGAVTAISYAHSKGGKGSAGMVLDSPFTSVKEMVFLLFKKIPDLMAEMNPNMPKFMVKAALIPIGGTIKSKTG